MAIRKVIGTETEFGVLIRNQPDFNPALASALVVNSFPGRRIRVQWSYEEESPGRDARGFGVPGYDYSDPDSSLVNAVLSNGARLYVDHAHPEYSGPECFDPLEAALHDKAGELAAVEAVRRGQTTLPEGQTLKLYKNNSDGKGNSYGAHENYLLDRATPFGQVVRHAAPFFVTRQIYTGTGKIGSENGRPDCDYQITQRADFFEELVGLETTLKRPIVNTRDEPHGDPGKYRTAARDHRRRCTERGSELRETGRHRALPCGRRRWRAARCLRVCGPGFLVLAGQSRSGDAPTVGAGGRRLGNCVRDPERLLRLAHQVRGIRAGRTRLGRRSRSLGVDSHRSRDRSDRSARTASTGCPRSGCSTPIQDRDGLELG